MNANLKPYPVYRDSGSPWIGKIPKHWKLRRLKHICRLEYGDSLTCETRKEGSVPVFGSNGFVGAHNVANTKSPCIIVGRKGSFGKINYSSVAVFAIDTTFFIDDRYTSANLRWLYFLLSNLQLDAVTKDSAVPGLGRKDAYQRIALFPPLAEQVAVARFLDHIGSHVESFVDAKEQLIALLKEKRQTVIDRAVTRGLGPNTTFRATGIDWMPEVPAHWEVRRLKSCVKNVVEVATRRCSGEMYIALEHVESWTGEILNIDFDTVFESQVKRFQNNDVLFGKLRPYLAKATRPERVGVCTGEFLVLRSKENNPLPGYLESWLRTKSVIDAINASTYGAKMPRAEWQFIGNMGFPLPPLSEQSAISDYLDTFVSDIQVAINSAQRQIKLVHEYYERLTNDVVTGKLDVRNVQLDFAPDSGNRNSPLSKLFADFDARGVRLNMADNLPREALYRRNASS